MTPLGAAVCQRCARGWASLQARGAATVRAVVAWLALVAGWLARRSVRFARVAQAIAGCQLPRSARLADALAPRPAPASPAVPPRPQVLASYRHLLAEARAGRRPHPEFDLASSASR